MRLKRDARVLKSKGIASLRRGLEIFNSYDEHGRTESVLLHLQHCCEMLLKALLIQKSHPVFDEEKGMSIGIEKALKVSSANGYITNCQVGTIRAIDALRDAAQHWMVVVSEEMLYLNSRALITVIDEILKTHFSDALSSNLPVRVLPISTQPLKDFNLLINREYSQIVELLAPKKRARDEARCRIRTLLAMESYVTDSIAISERDINRIERAIRNRTAVADIFPRLMTLASDVSGEGVLIKVHISKKEGAPIRYISGDDPDAAAAIREVDLQKKYYLSPSELAAKLAINTRQCKALRDHLEIDANTSNVMVFEFGSQKHRRYSDNALKLLLEANTPETLRKALQDK